MPSSNVLLFDDELRPSEEGEIWISGPGLAIGYLNNEVETREKFVYYNGTRFYRTGDYARRHQGELIFRGRGDSLIKNRGFLVNIETEIIPAICSQPNVKLATAFQSNGQLVAFVTPASCQSYQIRLGMSNKYDPFVVPDHIYCLDDFPLTANGKINVHTLRKNLPALSRVLVGTAKTNEINLVILKSLVAQSLGLAIDDVNERASFWAQGGNSLSAIRLLTSLQSYNLSVTVSELLGSKDLVSLSHTLKLFQRLMSDEVHTTPIAVVPMAAMQERMLSVLSSKPLNNYIVLELEVPCGLDNIQEARYRYAWEVLLKRHSIFTSSFDLSKRSLQDVNHLKLDWHTVTVTNNKDWETEHRKQKHDLVSHMQASHSLYPEAVFRLIIAPGMRSCLLWLVHHSRIDGWSSRIIIEELQAILDGRALPTAPQFLEAAVVQRSIGNEMAAEAHNFWQSIIEKGSAAKSLSFPETAEQAEKFDDKREVCTYSGLSVHHIQNTCRQLNVSPSVVFYGAWALLLMHYTGCDIVSFGVVFSGRNLPMNGADRVVGPMINVCPFPVHAHKHDSRAQWLSNIQSQLDQMNEMQWSFDRCVSEISYQDCSSYDTLVSVQFDASNLEWCCKAVPTPWKLNQTQMSDFPWTLLVETHHNEYKFRLLYQPTTTTLSLTTRTLGCFKKVVVALLNPEFPTVCLVQEEILSTSEVQALTQKERDLNSQVYEHTSIKKAFEFAAENHTDLVALESISNSVTYGNLESAAKTVSWEIIPDAGSGKTVAVLSDGSINWIISIIGIVMTGAVYCPIDVNHAKVHAERMLLLSGATVLIVPDTRYKTHLAAPEGCRVVILQDLLDTQGRVKDRVPDNTALDDPIYMIFTSGTTGTPKGVCASNSGLLSYLSYEPARLHAAPGRRIAQMFSVGFDACAAEIFGTLCYGGTLLLKHPNNLFGHLRSANAAMMTPSLLAICSPDDFQNLDTIVLGGEAVSQHLADNWSLGRRLYNGYGPCECTVGSMFSQLSPQSRVTLGRPIPGMWAYILNEGRALAPIGIVGEIYLTGCQVTGGYFACEQKDTDRFLLDPWRPGQMMFRTGDAGRWTEAMEIEYLGRLDRQVKLRGHRINLEEVENVIQQSSSSIKQAAVIILKDDLVAFISPEAVEEDQIKEKTRQLLPHFAVPLRFIKMDCLPLSVNQKVDYKALAALQSLSTKKSTIPLTGLTHLLAQVWSEVLQQQQNDSLGIDSEDDFLQLGGHSILQLQLVRKLSERFKCTVPLEVITKNTILSHQAGALQRIIENPTRKRPHDDILLVRKRIQTMADSLVSDCEEEMIMLTNQYTVKSAYNMPCLLQIEGAVDITRLMSAIQHVLVTNKVLRSRFRHSNGKFVRHISEVASLSEARTVTKLQPVHYETDINRPFDFENDQLLKVILFQVNPESCYLLVIVHHSIMDGTSLNVFFQLVQDCYVHSTGKSENTLQHEKPLGSTPVVEENAYLEWLNCRALIADEGLLSFWRQYLQKRPLPFLITESTSPFHNTGGLLTRTLPQAISKAVESTCAKQRLSKQQLMLASIMLTVNAIYGIVDIVIAIPFSHREEPGTERLLGLLLDRLPIRLHLDRGLTSRNSLLESVKSSSDQALAHAMPYPQILNALSATEPLFELMVSFHARGTGIQFELPGCRVSYQRLRPQGAKFPCIFEFFDDAAGMALEVEYMAEQMDSTRVVLMVDTFERAVGLLCQDTVVPRVSGESASELGTIRESLAAFVQESTPPN